MKSVGARRDRSAQRQRGETGGVEREPTRGAPLLPPSNERMHSNLRLYDQSEKKTTTGKNRERRQNPRGWLPRPGQEGRSRKLKRQPRTDPKPLGESTGQTAFDFRDGPALRKGQRIREELRAGQDSKREIPGEGDLSMAPCPVVVRESGLGGRRTRTNNLDPESVSRWPRKESEMD